MIFISIMAKINLYKIEEFKKPFDYSKILIYYSKEKINMDEFIKKFD